MTKTQVRAESEPPVHTRPHDAGMMKARRNLDEATRRELAVQAEVDPRTIEKVLRGEPVRGMAGRRARRVLEAAGLTIPANLPSEGTPPTTGERP